MKKLRHGDVAADRDVADEVDAVALRDLVVALADGLERLVVRSNAEANKPVGNGIAIEDVDARLVRIGLLQRFRGVETRRTRTDHREMAHSISRHCERSEAIQLDCRVATLLA